MAAVVVLAAGGAFAIALRTDHPSATPLDPVERARAAARADREAMMEREEAERAKAEGAAADAIAHQVAGARPGQPGPLFDAVHFGSAGLSAAPAELDRINAEATRRGVGVGLEPQRLTARVSPAVADRIFHAWGDPPRDLDLHDPGTNAALHVSVEGAEVVFAWSPYETLAHRIDPGDGRPPGATPFSVVGAHVGDLSLALGARLRPVPRALGAHRLEWDLPPDAYGAPTLAFVETDGDVITRVEVPIDAPPGEVDHALHTIYGAGDRSWRHGALVIELDGHPPDGATVTATRAR
jgi:hypothetical protein